MKLDIFDWVALVLVMVGALNWGLVGLLNFDLVAFLFGGSMTMLGRIVYGLVGLAGAYMFYLLSRLKKS